MDVGGFLIVEELALCQNKARADLVLINGSLNGFEIKSDRDRFDRLKQQGAVYSNCFDTISLVVGAKHRVRALKCAPYWWGIIVVRECDGMRWWKLSASRLEMHGSVAYRSYNFSGESSYARFLSKMDSRRFRASDRKCNRCSRRIFRLPTFAAQ